QGCESAGVDPTVEPPLLQRLPRTLSSDELAAIRANNAFAFSLLGRVAKTDADKNVFLSPLSVSLALGMVMDGARGTTREAMANTLGFGTLPPGAINAGYRDLMALLGSLDEQVKLTIANSIWTEQTFPILPTFLGNARTYFDAEAEALDFRSPAAVSTINSWVNRRTDGKIPTILDNISSDEILFAINAVHFKGSWRKQFRPDDTRTGTFNAQDGRQQQVPFMHREGPAPYYAGSDFHAVDLWYGAGAYSMTVLVPTGSTTADDLVGRLTADQFATIADGLRDADVVFAMPKLRLDDKHSLRTALTQLGMGIAFTRQADLRGISDAAALQITRVDHKTFVDINEEGTEAAAVTSVGVGVTSAPVRVSVTVDRPYVFVIRERLSGTVLFTGRILSIP
ncbi:MAG: serpin family protein, partial [Gemmatimonadales bacterium]